MLQDRYTERTTDEALTHMLQECGKAVPTLTDDLKLDADLGLSSFEVTTLLVRLTSRLEAHSAEQIMTTEIATVGDLRRAFQASTTRGVRGERDPIAASRRRAEARRAAGR